MVEVEQAIADLFSRNSDNSNLAPPSPYPQFVDPSPTDSNGTENTDIDEDAQDNAPPELEADKDLKSPVKHPSSHEGVDNQSPQGGPDNQTERTTQLAKLDTTVSPEPSIATDDAPRSVIHAPEGFRLLGSSDSGSSRLGISPTQRSDHTVVSPSTPDAANGPNDKRLSTTNAGLVFDRRPTPQAQTEVDRHDPASPRPSTGERMLIDITESQDIARRSLSAPGISRADGRTGALTSAAQSLDRVGKELDGLRTALGECWTLCNTLANLSSIHRSRMFATSSRGNMQEHAWQSCWKLCQQLYVSWDEPSQQIQPTLELCRLFCQALFDARQRADEASDAVLRVNFELNNHLYNMHSQDLPQAFRQRTLDFYITICHRMMKQRTALPAETDALLRACWSLAETLFNLRQTRRQAKAADEELLGSAVQACWDLCDLFRDGWSQIRPDRSTPKPSQMTFAKRPRSEKTQSKGRTSSLSNRTYHDAPTAMLPETPITIFDDTTAASSPDSVSVPNILVLGPAPGTGKVRGTHHDRWSSNVSTFSSEYSEGDSSQHTSSTATASSDEKQLLRLRCLILKAALNAGFSRPMDPNSSRSTISSSKTSISSSRSSKASSKSSASTASTISNDRRPQNLQTFVKTLPPNAFGSLPWQTTVLENYRKLVLADPSLRDVDGPYLSVRNADGVLNDSDGDSNSDDDNDDEDEVRNNDGVERKNGSGARRQQAQRRLTAKDLAKAIRWLGGGNEQWGWMRDLFRLVFGFGVDEAEKVAGTVMVV